MANFNYQETAGNTIGFLKNLDSGKIVATAVFNQDKNTWTITLRETNFVFDLSGTFADTKTEKRRKQMLIDEVLCQNAPNGMLIK